jgi:eukaryotic-like serine/threonine-protein kinase
MLPVAVAVAKPSASSSTFASLQAGQHLGPYTIVGLLGVGGMGEVYLAHDPRLKRDVALKVLRRSLADPDRVARFSREARAAGSLNHPNIVAVFDVGTESGTPYVVTELLEGETLRDRMDRGMPPYRKAVDFAIQIAQALDAAHAKGIWHRDVKPANAFITNDGRVKLLDFGIAKLSEPDSRGGSEDPTIEDSQTGEIRGTAGYMSPEQVLGQPVDHRTDIFALGAVLYEMFTGARAFHRPSNVETMTAVLQEEPADPLAINPRLPPAAAAVVRHCLEKNKEERFQSARDLAFDLQQLREVTGGTKPIAALPIVPKKLRVPLTAAALVGGAALAGFLLWPGSDPPPASFEQLTFQRGRIGGARYATRGQAVVYSEARLGNELEISRLDLADSPVPRSLNYASGSDVLAARAGQLALSLRRRFIAGERFVGTLATVEVNAGSPREIAENVEDADWDPAGGLAIVRSTGDLGGPSKIEYPVGHTLYTTSGSIRFLRFARDGQRLAFLEDPTALGVGGSVFVVDLKGAVTRLTEAWESVRGLAWSSAGDEVWFTAGRFRANRALHAVTLDRKQRLVHAAPGSLTLWDIAADGRVLLTRDEERRFVMGLPPGEAIERDFSWYDDSGVADISDDGRLLLFADRFGVYVRGTDGSSPTNLLKEGRADDLSPDGSTVLATIGSGRQLVLVPRRAGDFQQLPGHGIITAYRGARWFPDGQRVLIAGVDAEGDVRSYIQDIKGGRPQALTPKRTWGVLVSPDGRSVAAIGTDQAITIWPVDGKGPIPVNGSEIGDRPVAWSRDGELWLFRRSEVPGQVFKLDINTGRRYVWKTLIPPDPTGVYSIIQFQVTPSGHAYAYTYARVLSQLYQVTGLR